MSFITINDFKFQILYVLFILPCFITQDLHNQQTTSITPLYNSMVTTHTISNFVKLPSIVLGLLPMCLHLNFPSNQLLEVLFLPSPCPHPNCLRKQAISVSQSWKLTNWIAFSSETVLVTQSYLTLCDPTDCSPTGSSDNRALQVRILVWVAISLSVGSSRPRNWTWVSHIAGRLFTDWATREDFFRTLFFWTLPNYLTSLRYIG